MDKKIKDLIILDAVNNCNLILSDTQDELTNMYKDGKLFFKGCIEGFELGKRLVCLEQFEQFIMSYRNKEEFIRNNQGLSYDKHDEYITNLGIRCALEFIYNNFSQESSSSPQPPDEYLK
jgi:hypothetical protein